MREIIQKLDGKSAHQWLLLLLLLPIGGEFGAVYNRFYVLAADKIFPSHDGDILPYFHYILLFAALSSGLLCYLLARKMKSRNIWLLLGFAFGRMAVFYALIISTMNRRFPQCEGIVFGKGFMEKSVSGRMTRLILILLLVLTLVFWGIFILLEKTTETSFY